MSLPRTYSDGERGPDGEEDRAPITQHSGLELAETHARQPVQAERHAAREAAWSFR